jgi:cbb3-type cytochrome oxidase subunit 3
VLFLVLVLRTFSSRRRDEYTEAANLPFVEDLPADVARGEKL